MGGPVQSQSRSDHGKRLSRRNASSGWREARALLQHVWSAILFYEDYGRSERSHGPEECRVPEGGCGHLREALITGEFWNCHCSAPVVGMESSLSFLP